MYKIVLGYNIEIFPEDTILALKRSKTNTHEY